MNEHTDKIELEMILELQDKCKDLIQENQQLKDLEYKFIDDGEEYSFTLEEYFDMGDKLYNCEQQLDKYKSIIDEARKFIKEKYEEDYSKNDNYNPIERLNLKNCSYERSLQVLEILNKVGDVK